MMKNPFNKQGLLTPAFIYAPLALMLFAFPVLAGQHEAKEADRDIVDTAIAAGDFNTLVTAVQEAGLVETLKGEGPYTVFAPNDEAFAKLPKEKLDALLADEEALGQVLTYHVVPGRIMAADVVKLDSAETVQGQSLNIEAGDTVRVNGARVLKTDIIATNGIIHVIDTVLLPD